MKARLPITSEVLREPEPPPFPPVILQQESKVVLFVTGWTFPLTEKRIKDVKARSVRVAMRLPENVELMLSDVRPVPFEDLYSPEFIAWLRTWWAECANKMRLILMARSA